MSFYTTFKDINDKFDNFELTQLDNINIDTYFCTEPVLTGNFSITNPKTSVDPNIHPAISDFILIKVEKLVVSTNSGEQTWVLQSLVSDSQQFTRRINITDSSPWTDWEMYNSSNGLGLICGNLLTNSYYGQGGLSCGTDKYGFPQPELNYVVYLEADTVYTLTICGYTTNSNSWVSAYVRGESWKWSSGGTRNINTNKYSVGSVTFRTPKTLNPTDKVYVSPYFGPQNQTSGTGNVKWMSLVKGAIDNNSWSPAMSDLTRTSWVSGNNGYTLEPGKGTCEQWGYSGGGKGWKQINLPLTMTNTFYNVLSSYFGIGTPGTALTIAYQYQGFFKVYTSGNGFFWRVFGSYDVPATPII